MGQTAGSPDAGETGADEFPVGDELRGERATMGKSLLDVQRDLRIKAAYIAAIEDADLTVFPNKAVIPGYVRSYARYLHLVPEEIYLRFCRQSGFSLTAPGTGLTKAPRAKTPAGTTGSFRPDFPLAMPRGFALPAVPLSAIGSLLVLLGLVAGLGYGGWTVLRNIQRVQFAPVEELPLAIAELDAITAPEAPALVEPTLIDLATPVAATALADLYRHQEAEVPILVPRDGPIAAIDPDKIGLLAGRDPVYRAAPAAKPPIDAARDAPFDAEGAAAPGVDAEAVAIASAVAAAMTAPDGPPAPGTAPDAAAGAPAKLTVVAERAAWIRVYLENGTIIFERILEKGETYSPPDGVGAPLIWAGNSGSVYVRVGDALHGPLGQGTRAARDVVLDPGSIVARFALVEQVPEVISQTLGAEAPRPEAAVAIQ